ncbi:3-oxoacyl-ACP synthase III family protein [Pseudoalteromonas sp. S16_S37]|uniref:3-oxoacyl-ACP synthase III family protein n=1 Tax=Pseudoalteromonas sp. S16_S37 TaxID=2720228 RepID=UPI0016812ED3|nr:ketoacyl-ACP synthase III [Pseudoalteromonas sp. S16_S37]MBD1582311.1 ketoacyl-ACP synthase III [Pseudoalteromonas sp. S16_S37]
MAMKTISGIRIEAISAALPATTIGSEEFAALYGQKEAARVARGTGISAIRTADGLSTQALISAAAQQLLRNVDVTLEEIDALIVVTQTPDSWSPGTAFAVHSELGLKSNCYVATINDGCAGYVNGMIQAASLVSSGAYKKVLLCTGDVNTRLVDDADYQVRMLFGDAASATLISQGEETVSFINGTDGSGKDMLGVKMNYEKAPQSTASVATLKMDGAAVMSFALKRVPEVVSALLNQVGVNKDQVDLFALHQPNEFILNYLINLLDVEPSKVPIDVNGIGNTNSTSIPLLLTRHIPTSELSNIVLCGFGVGLAWNAMHVTLANTALIEPVEISTAA